MDIALAIFLFLGLGPLSLLTLGAAGLAHFLKPAWTRPLLALSLVEGLLAVLVWANQSAVSQALFPTGHF